MLDRISGKGHRKPSSSPEVRANILVRNLSSNVRSFLGLKIGNSPSTSVRTSGIPLPQNRLWDVLRFHVMIQEKLFRGSSEVQLGPRVGPKDDARTSLRLVRHFSIEDH
jgi:hypothetical protein